MRRQDEGRPRPGTASCDDPAKVPHRLPETPVLDGMSAGLRAFADGFSAGAEVGHELGVRHGEAAEARLWSEALGILQQTANRPLQAELQRRRAEDPTDPCPARCRRCSQCARSIAWWSRGGRDYYGREAEAALAERAVG